MFPPLMSTLDVYMESAADSRFEQVVASVKNGQKNKNRMKKSSGSTNPSRVSVESAIRPESRVMDSRSASIEGDVTVENIAGIYSSETLSLRSKTTPGNMNSAGSPTPIEPTKPKSAFKSVCGPKSPSRKLIAPLKNVVSVDLSASSNLVSYDLVEIGGQQTNNTELLIPVAKTDLGFAKAVESLAALKLHNYAIKRKEQVEQKSKLQKEIRSYQRENDQSYRNAQKLRSDQQQYNYQAEILAAWKIRYYVEYMRLNSMKAVIDSLEEKRQKCEVELTVAQQKLAVAEHQTQLQLQSRLDKYINLHAAETTATKEELLQARDKLNEVNEALLEQIRQNTLYAQSTAELKKERSMEIEQLNESREELDRLLSKEREDMNNSLLKEKEEMRQSMSRERDEVVRLMQLEKADMSAELQRERDLLNKTRIQDRAELEAQLQQETANMKQSVASMKEKMDAAHNELQITRLTCQTLVRAAAEQNNTQQSLQSTLNALQEKYDTAIETLAIEHQKQINISEQMQMQEEDAAVRYIRAEQRYLKADGMQLILEDRERLLLSYQTQLTQVQSELVTKSKQLMDAQECISHEKEELRSAVLDKTGLQMVVTEVARKLTIAQEKNVNQSAEMKKAIQKNDTLQSKLAQSLSQSDELQQNLESVQQENSFLFEVNEELSRELECRQMLQEESNMRYFSMHSAAERQLEYARFLEEELFTARKMYERQQVNNALESTTGTSVRKFGRDQYAVVGGKGSEVVYLDNSKNNKLLLSRPNTGDGALDAPMNRPRSAAEQKLLLLMQSLEERMRRVDAAATDSLRLLQAERAHADEHKIQQDYDLQQQQQQQEEATQLALQQQQADLEALQSTLRDGEEENSFLLEVNEELSRELECHQMSEEESNMRYFSMYSAAERQLEYARFLEEELFTARKMYERQVQVYNSSSNTDTNKRARLAVQTGFSGLSSPIALQQGGVLGSTFDIAGDISMESVASASDSSIAALLMPWQQQQSDANHPSHNNSYNDNYNFSNNSEVLNSHQYLYASTRPVPLQSSSSASVAAASADNSFLGNYMQYPNEHKLFLLIQKLEEKVHAVDATAAISMRLLSDHHRTALLPTAAAAPAMLLDNCINTVTTLSVNKPDSLVKQSYSNNDTAADINNSTLRYSVGSTVSSNHAQYGNSNAASFLFNSVSFDEDERSGRYSSFHHSYDDEYNSLQLTKGTTTNNGCRPDSATAAAIVTVRRMMPEYLSEEERKQAKILEENEKNDKIEKHLQLEMIFTTLYTDLLQVVNTGIMSQQAELSTLQTVKNNTKRSLSMLKKKGRKAARKASTKLWTLSVPNNSSRPSTSDSTTSSSIDESDDGNSCSVSSDRAAAAGNSTSVVVLNEDNSGILPIYSAAQESEIAQLSREIDSLIEKIAQCKARGLQLNLDATSLHQDLHYLDRCMEETGCEFYRLYHDAIINYYPANMLHLIGQSVRYHQHAAGTAPRAAAIGRDRSDSESSATSAVTTATTAAAVTTMERLLEDDEASSVGNNSVAAKDKSNIGNDNYYSVDKYDLMARDTAVTTTSSLQLSDYAWKVIKKESNNNHYQRKSAAGHGTVAASPATNNYYNGNDVTYTRRIDVDNNSTSSSVAVVLKEANKNSSGNRVNNSNTAGLQSMKHQLRTDTNRNKQAAREQLAAQKAELEHLLADLDGAIEEVQLLLTTREEVRLDIVRWLDDFQKLCGYEAEQADKMRSSTLCILFDAFTDAQNEIKSAYNRVKVVTETAIQRRSALWAVQQQQQRAENNNKSIVEQYKLFELNYSIPSIVQLSESCYFEDPYNISSTTSSSDASIRKYSNDKYIQNDSNNLNSNDTETSAVYKETAALSMRSSNINDNNSSNKTTAILSAQACEMSCYDCDHDVTAKNGSKSSSSSYGSTDAANRIDAAVSADISSSAAISKVLTTAIADVSYLKAAPDYRTPTYYANAQNFLADVFTSFDTRKLSSTAYSSPVATLVAAADGNNEDFVTAMQLLLDSNKQAISQEDAADRENESEDDDDNDSNTIVEYPVIDRPDKDAADGATSYDEDNNNSNSSSSNNNYNDPPTRSTSVEMTLMMDSAPSSPSKLSPSISSFSSSSYPLSFLSTPTAGTSAARVPPSPSSLFPTTATTFDIDHVFHINTNTAGTSSSSSATNNDSSSSSSTPNTNMITPVAAVSITTSSKSSSQPTGILSPSAPSNANTANFRRKSVQWAIDKIESPSTATNIITLTNNNSDQSNTTIISSSEKKVLDINDKNNDKVDGSIIEQLDPIQRKTLEDEYSRIKKYLKRWKRHFIEQHGREPLTDDFNNLDPSLQNVIVRKQQLKQTLEGSQ